MPTTPPPRLTRRPGQPTRTLLQVACSSLFLVACGTLSLVACSDSGEAEASADTAEPNSGETATAPSLPIVESFEATTGVGQVLLVFDDPEVEVEGDVAPIDSVALVSPDQQVPVDAESLDAEVAQATIAADGTVLLRDLEPGATLTPVLLSDERPVALGPNIVVAGTDPPDNDFYADQPIEEGYGYITVRDGTTLSAFVTLPGPIDEGPYPTLVDYSGYSPSDPGADDPARLLLPLLGYALVQVNVRGTGCSGGSFAAFEPIQSYDGYDVIETVAAQPWTAAVGMFGISYPGIMQLHVAATQPPSLAAIAPLSVIDRVESVLFPGGVFNDGFGQEWVDRVSTGAEAEGQAWARERIEADDTVCANNQALRQHNPDMVAQARANPFRNELSESRSPQVENINVPVFLAGAWQDEQTGGRFPALIPRFTASPAVRAALYNGMHVDPLGPEILSDVIEFYDLFVADQQPQLDPFIRFVAGTALQEIFGAPLAVPDSPYRSMDVDDARKAYAEDPTVTVYFEMGADEPGLPVARFQGQFDQWPPAEVVPLRYHLTRADDGDSANAGLLTDAAPTAETEATFTTDPEEGQVTTVADLARIASSNPGYDWPEPVDGEHLRYLTPPLEEDVTMVGPASVDLLISSSETDAEVEVTITEVAPDGTETYVQSGWLRLSRRALAPGATPLRPVPSLAENDVALLNPGEPTAVRIEVFPFAHVFRTGSRIGLLIDTPGASRPSWRFETPDAPTELTVHEGPDASSIALPVLPLDAGAVPAERPACGSLRGQPCRGG